MRGRQQEHPSHESSSPSSTSECNLCAPSQEMRLHWFHFSQIHMCIKYRISHLRGAKGLLPVAKGHRLDWSNLSCRDKGRKAVPSTFTTRSHGRADNSKVWVQAVLLCQTSPSLCSTQVTHSFEIGTAGLKQSGVRKKSYLRNWTLNEQYRRSESAIKAQALVGRRPSPPAKLTLACVVADRVGTSRLSRGCPWVRIARTVTKTLLDEARPVQEPPLLKLADWNQCPAVKVPQDGCNWRFFTSCACKLGSNYNPWLKWSTALLF